MPSAVRKVCSSEMTSHTFVNMNVLFLFYGNSISKQMYEFGNGNLHVKYGLLVYDRQYIKY
jgi:hypothetical protein